jgi:hypothetical protein
MAFNSEMQRALIADGEKLRDLLGVDHGPWFEVPFLLVPEKQLCKVEYRGRTPCLAYVSPDEFFWHNDPGPTDCTWVVPGTALPDAAHLRHRGS